MRRRRPEKRTILPDPIYKDLVVAQFINYIMKNLIVQIFMDKKGWEEENRLDAQSEQVLFLSNVLVNSKIALLSVESSF